MELRFGTQNAARKETGKDGFGRFDVKTSRIEPNWFANAERYWENRE